MSDDLRRYTGLFWHWAWLILMITLIGGTAGFLFSWRQPPIYKASATILINNEARNQNEYTNLVTGERLAQTYSKLMIQNPVLDGVIQELGLDTTAAILKEQITIKVVENTQLIAIDVTDENPGHAAAIANSIASVFARQNADFQSARYRDSKENLQTQLASVDAQLQTTQANLEAIGDDPERKLERDRQEANLALYQQIYSNLIQSFEQIRLAEIQGTSNIILVEPATAPTKPVGPNIPQNTILAAVVGLMLAAGLVVLIEALDDTVKGPTDVTQLLGLPVLALVAKIDDPDEGPITMLQPRSPMAESFRSLRTNIQYASVDRPLRTLVITSPTPKDGKSTVAANLAVALAQSGRQVTLLDADLRRPTQHKLLKVSNRKGLSDLFVQPQVFFDGAIREMPVEGLTVITSGGLPPNPSELVGSEKMIHILQELGSQADLIVIDTPPLTAVTDAAVLAPRTDGVLLVIRPGQTKLALARQAVEQLHRVGARILGVVLNDVENVRGRYYYYYKGYDAYRYDYYGEGEGKTKRRANGAKREPVKP